MISYKNNEIHQNFEYNSHCYIVSIAGYQRCSTVGLWDSASTCTKDCVDLDQGIFTEVTENEGI